MSLSERGCGCLVIIGVFAVVSMISKCNDKHSSAPKVSQPTTGYVSPARSESPRVSEPFGQLQSGGFANSESALKMTNNLRDPAYVKVQDSSGRTRATIYLRAGESYELGVSSGSYRLKYVSGPSDEWRGTEHYFGSRSSYRAANLSYINSNQRLSVTFYQTVSRSGSSGNGMQKIGEDEF
jgi:hypothetical protein